VHRWDLTNAAPSWLTSNYTNIGKTLTGNATFTVFKSNMTKTGTVMIPGAGTRENYIAFVGCT